MSSVVVVVEYVLDRVREQHTTQDASTDAQRHLSGAQTVAAVFIAVIVSVVAVIIVVMASLLHDHDWLRSVCVLLRRVARLGRIARLRRVARLWRIPLVWRIAWLYGVAYRPKQALSAQCSRSYEATRGRRTLGWRVRVRLWRRTFVRELKAQVNFSCRRGSVDQLEPLVDELSVQEHAHGQAALADEVAVSTLCVNVGRLLLLLRQIKPSHLSL
jgi:hypothetical protein